jgi:peptidoglycan/xylan/chitin deacetylase (PgdA/CDA1 family)
VILCYHAVSDNWEHPFAVRRGAFERQLRTLLFRGYRAVTASESVGARGKSLHVTFDDGFKNVRNALPALERFRIPATIFACADYAADGRPLNVPRLAAEAASHPEHLATLTWEELRAVAERGMEIGSHTLTHSHLPDLSDGELDRELRDSRALFEAELDRPCRFVAYPWGQHDERVRVATRRAGYEAAFALRAGADASDRYALPRVDIYRRDHLLRAMVKTSFLMPVGWRLRRLGIRGDALP